MFNCFRRAVWSAGDVCVGVAKQRSFALNPLATSKHCQPQTRRAVYMSTADFNATVEETLRTWCARFQAHRVSEPLESIANILASVLKTSNLGDVYKHRKRPLSDVQLENVNAMCEKRMENMPVQYIVGEWDFREINLKIRAPVFIPRPETEMLVELVLQDARVRGVDRMLEFCCGSGAICLSLLHSLPKMTAVTIDLSKDAYHLCKENANLLRLSERLTITNCSVEDFHSEEQFDIIVSNPPYVLRRDLRDLQPEIKLYEDVAALDGGEDGLDVVRQILDAAAGRLLKPGGGRLFLEVDPLHPARIRDMLRQLSPPSPLAYVRAHTDLQGVERFVEIIKNGA